MKPTSYTQAPGNVLSRIKIESGNKNRLGMLKIETDLK